MIHATSVIPDMRVVFFHRLTDNALVRPGSGAARTTSPHDVCAAASLVLFIHNPCEFADWSVIRLRETLDAFSNEGVAECNGDYLDISNSGDRLVVTYSAMWMTTRPRWNASGR